MVAYNIDDRGVAIEDDGHFMDAMETIVAYHTPKLAREAEDLAEEIIKRADYSHFVATINTDRLRDAFPVAFVDERGNVIVGQRPRKLKLRLVASLLEGCPSEAMYAQRHL